MVISNAPADPSRPLSRDASVVLGGNISALGAQVALLFFAARALDPRNLGVVAVALSWQLMVDRLFSFQSWQAVTHFGAKEEASNNGSGLSRIIRICWALDAGAALVGGILAFGVSTIGAHVLSLGHDGVMALRTASLGAMTLSTGTSIGLLRLNGRMSSVAGAQVVGASVRTILASLLLLIGNREPLPFLYASIGADMIVAATLHSLAFVRMREVLRGNNVRMADEAGTNVRTIAVFALRSNLAASMRSIARESDVLLLSAYGGPALAGILRLSKQIGSAPLILSDSLYFAAIPRFAKYAARSTYADLRREMRRVTKFGIWLAGAAFIGFTVLGNLILAVMLPSSSPAMYHTTLAYLAGTGMAVASAALQPAMLAIGDAKGMLMVMTASTCAYLLALVSIAGAKDSVAFASAFSAFYATWILLTLHRLRGRQVL